MNRQQRQRKLVPIYMLLAIIAIVVIVIALASGGGDDSDIGQVGTLPVIIPPTTKVLPLETTMLLTDISADGTTYTFAQETPALLGLNPGDIIVSDVVEDQAPNGYLRQVNRVAVESGRVVVETSPTSLPDAIHTGEIHFSQKLTPADVQKVSQAKVAHAKLVVEKQLQDEFVFDFKDIILYDDDGDVNTIHDQLRGNGEIKLAPTINFDYKILNHQEREFIFSVELENTTTLEVEAGVDLFNFDKSVEVARFMLHPITVWVGYVPVVITPIITVDVGVEGDVSVGIKNAVTTVQTISATYSWNTLHGVDTYSEYDEQTTYEPVRVYAKCSFKGYARPKFLLLIYGVVGPYGAGQTYLQLIADPFDVPWWKFYFGLDFEIGGRLEILGEELADIRADIITYRILLDQAEDPYNITITPSAEQPSPIITPYTPGIDVPLPIFGGNASTVMVFDTSGSMDMPDQTGMTKIDAAKNAGNRILDIIQAEADSVTGFTGQIGVVRFSNRTSVVLPLSSNIQEARSAIQRLFADGRTGMAGGMRASIDLLSRDSNQASPIMILLSDGLPNILLNGESRDNYDPDIRREVLDLANEAGRIGICIYTVGFGEPLTSGGSIDEDLLRQIANASGCGEYYSARDATQLANVYVELRHLSTGNILLRESGTITQDEELLVGTIDLPEYQSQILYTLNWPGSLLEPVLVDPNNQLVDSSYPGVSFSNYSSLASIIIKDPIAGQWQISTKGIDVPGVNTTYNAILSARPSPATPIPTQEPATPTPKQEAPVSSSLPIAILLLIVGGGAVALYVLAQMAARKREKGSHTGSSGSLQLVGRSGEASGQSYPVANGTVIGRATTCQIQLTEESVSRQHARLRLSQGKWYIQDLSSKLGTYVNGQRLNASVLNNGDRIRIGTTEFEVAGR